MNGTIIMKKRLYIFDMGGVVCSNVDVMPDVARSLGLSYKAFISAAKPLQDELSDGLITPEEFWSEFSARTGIEVAGDPFAEFFRPVVEHATVRFIERLKAGARVVCGTNTYDCHYRIHSERRDYDVFERVYASHLMHISKPDPGFYRRILEAEGVDPTDAVFVDDREENVSAARSLGIDSFLFTDAARLEADLRQAGILNGAAKRSTDP